MEFGLVKDLILPLLGAAAGGVSAYVAIRSDLAVLKYRMDHQAETLKAAHARIDSLAGKLGPR